MKDRLGNQIREGYNCIVVTGGRNEAVNLEKGFVVQLTTKMVRCFIVPSKEWKKLKSYGFKDYCSVHSPERIIVNNTREEEFFTKEELEFIQCHT
jgi:hypothetical protein